MTPEETPRAEFAPEQPMPWIWFFVLATIALVSAGALMAIVSPPGVKGEQLEIHRVLLKGQSETGPTISAPEKSVIEGTIAELQAIEPNDAAAKGTVARALLVLRQVADPDRKPDFSGLVDKYGNGRDALTPEAESSDDIAKVNKTLTAIYTDQDLTDEERKEHAKTLGELGGRWPLDLATQKQTATGSILSEQEVLLGGIALVVLLLGTGCLIFVVASPGINEIPLAGTPATGDNLGVRFLIFMAAFMFVGSAIVYAIPDRAIGAAAATAGLLVLVLLIVGAGIKGRVFTAKQIGLRSDSLGMDLLYGVMAFLGNFPAIVILMVVGLNFLNWIPSGGHPIQTEIFAGANLPLMILTTGPLTALVEELAFRGLLFQGLALRFRGWPAILISSLAFAMIHPQGGALWLSLGWIGGMGAYLTYKRRSLVPAIVMHALHNTAIIILAYYLTAA